MDELTTNFLRDTFDISGKIIVVTGAGRGLGKNISQCLAKAGANLVLVSRTLSELERTGEEVKKCNREALLVKADLTNENEVKNMVDVINKEYGKIDVLINNAGVGSVVGPLEKMDLSDWQLVINSNVTSIFLCSKAMIPLIRNSKNGKIINMASMFGTVVNPYLDGGAYCTSKFAVVGLTKALASELAPHIKVNAIAPGYCRTKPNEDFFNSNPGFYEKVIDMTPLRRICEPEELCGLVVYLCSEASDFMTGSVIVIDGGYTIW